MQLDLIGDSLYLGRHVCVSETENKHVYIYIYMSLCVRKPYEP